LAGRRAEALSDREQRNIVAAAYSIDRFVDFVYDGQATRCRLYEVDGEEFCNVAFGPDIYPGAGVLDPNSYLSVNAAIAHECSHVHRWRDQTEINDNDFGEVDEALTSLEAISRYHDGLSPVERRQLVSDAIQRLKLYVARKREEG
jgi:hypothetical protein